MTDLARRLMRNYNIGSSNNNDDRRKVIDLTNIGTSSSTINDNDNPNIFCEYCSVPLIKKMQ